MAFTPIEKADLQSTLSMPLGSWGRSILLGIEPSKLLSDYYRFKMSLQFAKACNNLSQISSKIRKEQCFGTSAEKMQTPLEILALRRKLYDAVIYNFQVSRTNRKFDDTVRNGRSVAIYVSDSEREQIYQFKNDEMTFTQWAHPKLLIANEMTRSSWSKSEEAIQRFRELGHLINQIARKVNTDAYYNIPQTLPEIVYYLRCVRNKAESLLCDISKSS